MADEEQALPLQSPDDQQSSMRNDLSCRQNVSELMDQQPLDLSGRQTLNETSEMTSGAAMEVKLSMEEELSMEVEDDHAVVQAEAAVHEQMSITHQQEQQASQDQQKLQQQQEQSEQQEQQELQAQQAQQVQQVQQEQQEQQKQQELQNQQERQEQKKQQQQQQQEQQELQNQQERQEQQKQQQQQLQEQQEQEQQEQQQAHLQQANPEVRQADPHQASLLPPQPPTQQQNKGITIINLCKLGQETIQDICSQALEIFHSLSELSMPNGTSYVERLVHEKKLELQDKLRVIKLKFKQLHQIFHKCNENYLIEAMEYVDIESLVPLKEKCDLKHDRKTTSEVYRLACEEKERLTEQVVIRGRQLKDIIFHLRRLISELSAMLYMRLT